MDTLARNRTEPQDGGHAPIPLLPEGNPLEMPPSQLWTLPPQKRTPRFSRLRLAWRRMWIFAGTAALTFGGAYAMYKVVEVSGITALESVVLALYVVLFAWIAFSFTSALSGFFVLLFRKCDDFKLPTVGPLPPIASKTALLLPTYNEDPGHVVARLQAIHESIGVTGYAGRFDWFLLSDTSDPAIWIAEEARLLRLREEKRASNIYYRHRYDNSARKSGNIGEWVSRFGGHYDHMIVLDADSLMSGDTIVRLVAAMEQNLDIGLIQTLPIIVNAKTLFSRLQQFAGRLYGPMIAAGIAWWHGPDGNYWGHNAIIRIHAFAGDAGLPRLPGRKPFGGHILSHDFIEAALMRRAGWAIRMAPTLDGSFEESPPSLLDFAARDRRWCQGNLQHAAILPAPGLHWMSRIHLLTGIGSYLTSPLWMIFLVFGILISLQAQFVRPEYFPEGFSLFPQWPAQDSTRAAEVFAGTVGLLIFPKLLAFILLQTRREELKQFGGTFRTLAGVLIEILMSSFIAPIMMVFQSRAVVESLLGRDAGWQVQRRSDGAIPRREMTRKCAEPTVLGLTMAASAYAVSIPLLLWMSPIVLGLLLAIPIANVTSSSRLSMSCLLAIPEETAPPQIMRRASELIIKESQLEEPLMALRKSEQLYRVHLGSLADTRSTARGQIDPCLATARAKIDEARTFEEAREFLSTREVFAILQDRKTLKTIIEMT